MRNKIKKLINKLGYNISRINRKIDPINFDELLIEKVEKINPIIFDVGGNTGQSVSKFKKIFNNPIIHSFEPNKTVFEIMINNFQNDKKVFCNNCALGDKNEEKDFNITNMSGKSSFYKINPDTSRIKIERYKPSILKTEKVKIIKLDDYIEEKKIDHIDFMKIDAQLYEDKILKGSLNTLQNNKIKILQVEILFNDYYEKYFTFSDIEKYLISNNFRMVGIDMINNNIFKGPQFGADAYYFNKKYYKV